MSIINLPDAGTIAVNQISTPKELQPGAGIPEEAVAAVPKTADWYEQEPILTVSGIAPQGSSFEGGGGGVPMQTLKVLF